MQQIAADQQQANAPPSRVFRASWRGWPLLALVAISVISYANTVGGYFYSDDFPFLKLVGDVDRIGPGVLQTFFATRCAEFQAFLYCYRPLPDVIFLLEYMLAGVKPFWYHVANIACHAACAVLVYLLGARLLRNAEQPKLIAFVAAAMFATCPIYGEIIFGPTNIVSGSGALFFLGSFALYLRWLDTQSRKALFGSVACFAASLLSKELAALLPFILAICCVKDKRSLRSLIPFGVVIALYLVARTAVLGPILGGYSGILGDLNSDGWRDRFFSPWPLYCLFPFHANAFEPFTPLKAVLSIAYVGLLVLAALRLFDKTRARTKTEAGLLALWLVLSVLPVLSVWNIEPGLAGGRHTHLLAVPLFMLASLFTYSRKYQRHWVVAWSVIAITFMYADVRNNEVYVQASQQTFKVKQAIDAQIATLKPGQKLFFLNPPFQWKGLYLFNTAIMFRAMCDRPVATVAYNDRILLPSRWFNSNYEQLDLQRLKELTDDPTIKPVTWDEETQQLKPLEARLGTGSQTIELQPVYTERNQFNQVARCQFFVDPKVLNTEVDFIELDLKSKITPNAPKAQPAVSVHWQTEDLPQFNAGNVLCLPVTTDGINRHYRFPMSNSMRWWLQKKNGCFEIRMPSAGFENEITNIRTIGWRFLAPAAKITDAPIDGDGVHNVSPLGFTLTYDASKVRNAKQVVVEVSRPDSVLEKGIVVGRRDYDSKDKALIRRKLSDAANSIVIKPNELPKAGVYEIEVGTVDASGKLGYFSDPLFIRIANKNERSI